MASDYFSTHGIKHVDYKDVDILKRFLNPHGRLLNRRKTNLSATHQRQLEQAVKRARFMGLLPYVSR
ncbi:30S ribosomal protein S18 [Candidatus Kaiserbacteria bacterium CG10_big_fil_rev_8_21_14_0_10_49_17]|uniref:Small ribosomal subunit protein bS18 n=1 Tax=Candidatus Kaiserbacteria bacterium CG10_big_fil_rev_8_21_14_0_10_49_17 TaxID=1974609 RepID=A0A2M6WDP3_9BACT|nr:MAG: 30S ribosomal protein S18 [Candidatus Kaiserbacteria bacterium CG10_big_fil_rev_8_21_14_0_10_49_17]